MKLLVVSAVWLVVSVLVCGVGALARRRFGSRAADEGDVIFDWWIGWALTVAFLLAWHLALAITIWAWIPIVVAGATGAWMARKDWTRALQPVLQERIWLAAPIVLAWLAVAALALGPERQYDTALYHLQSVRWAQAYPVVPGLANVDSRFAMNSSFFLFGALLETVQIAGRSLRLSAGILFLPVIIQGIVTLHAAAMRERKLDLLRWFQVLMIPVALWQARQYSSALSPDGVMFVITVVLSGELIRILSRDVQTPNGNESGRDWDYRIFGIVLLAATGVTVKISFAIFAATAAAIGLWSWASVRPDRWLLLACIIVPSFFVAVLWIAHGVVLSGYVAYPSPIGSFPVDWRVPPSVVKGQADWMVTWARSPGMHPGDVIGKYHWVTRWLANTVRDRDVIAAAFTLAFAGLLRIVTKPRQQPKQPARHGAFMFLLPSLLAVGVWFLTAPVIRLTLGPLWVIAVGSLALSLAGSSVSLLGRRHARIAMHAPLVLLLVAAFAIGLSESGSASSPHPVRKFTTLSGLTVYVPVKGDQCGDAPLPCSSLPPDARVELRQPGTFAKGFRVDYSRMNTPTGSENNARE